MRLESLESRRLMAAVVMSDWEQLTIELINRARANPAAEARRYGIGLNDGLPPGTISTASKQPLAPHQALLNAADAHSQDMLNRDFFSHENPDGEMPWDRMLEAGYRYSLAGENIVWSGTTGALDRDAAIHDHHAGFMRSPGHRANLFSPGFREIGAGVKHGVFTADRNYNASMLTEKFGTRAGDAFITGVIYDDQVVQDNFYTIGEGWDQVTVAAVEASSGVEFVTVSGPSGGYSLQVPPGVYTVTVGGDLLRQPIVFSSVTIGSENRKLDAEFTAAAIGPPPTPPTPPTPSAWQNPEDPLDVNDDERITPLDALVVINYLNRTGGGALPPASSSPDAPPPPYLDVTGTGSVGPLDVLVIVNHLNRASAASGEFASAVDAALLQGAASANAALTDERLEVQNRLEEELELIVRAEGNILA
uniref:dockerin type I domain-containing protein n=1 Tax=Candidatus Laterigemmans baculatus TaxID=2770505 RepID=UPI0013DAD177